jgi:hypothetical protein
MIQRKMKNKSLGNPAVLATVLNSDVAKDKMKTQSEIAKSTIPFIVKTLFVLAIFGFAYYKITNRFKALSENANYPTSNITEGQATTKADAIFEAMYGIGSNFDIVAYNIAGLNYNAWVKLYNAFGERRGSDLQKGNLVEWLNDQFSNYELEQLRFLVSNVFKNSNNAIN